MKIKKKIIATCLVIASGLVVLSGCGMSNEDRGPTTSFDPSKVLNGTWYIHRIRTPQGGMIKTGILESWKSDQLYGKHLSSDTYVLTFSGKNEVVYKNIDGTTINGTWKKEQKALYVNFDNGNSYVGGSFFYDEYSHSETLIISDIKTDMCYEFLTSSYSLEEDYQKEKTQLDTFTTNYLEEKDYLLTSINGIVADGTHTYHETKYDAHTYSINFKKIDNVPCFIFNNKISETETDSYTFTIDYDAKMNEDGLYLVPYLTYVPGSSSVNYFNDLKLDVSYTILAGIKILKEIVVSFGQTQFIFN